MTEWCCPKGRSQGTVLYVGRDLFLEAMPFPMPTSTTPPPPAAPARPPAALQNRGLCDEKCIWVCGHRGPPRHIRETRLRETQLPLADKKVVGGGWSMGAGSREEAPLDATCIGCEESLAMRGPRGGAGARDWLVMCGLPGTTSWSHAEGHGPAAEIAWTRQWASVA